MNVFFALKGSKFFIIIYCHCPSASVAMITSSVHRPDILAYFDSEISYTENFLVFFDSYKFAQVAVIICW